MGKVYDGITPALREFIEAQHVVFVATAPDAPDGHVNLSPKGLKDTFAVIDERTVAYLDLTGSGVETIAHLRDNGRITLMLCAFSGPPKIVRLHGIGRAVLPGDEEWERLAALFPARRNTRSVVVVDVTRVSDSCGFGVPLLELAGERDHLDRWADARNDEQIADYMRTKNVASIDGLPGLPGTPSPSPVPRSPVSDDETAVSQS